MTYDITGTHIYSHTDAHGCTQVDTLYLTIHEMSGNIDLAISFNSICDGEPNGSIVVTSPVGDGYLYSIDGVTFKESPTFTGLGAQSYHVYVKDRYGCMADAIAEVSDEDFDVDALAVVPCEGGDISLSADIFTMGSVTFSWTSTNGFTSIEQNPVIENATSADNGTYTVTVTESATGCSSSSSVVVAVKLPSTGETSATACDNFV